MRFLDSVKPNQYGPPGFWGAGPSRLPQAASVGQMSDGTRENGNRNKAHTDEAALSARLQRLGEGLGQARERGVVPSGDDSGGDRAATASGYARGFRLSSELVAGVLVGAGLGWLIDRLFGI